MSGTGDRTGVVPRLVGSLAGEVGGENSRGSQGGRSWEASGSQSYLKQDEKLLSEGATAAEEVEVVGTCVYYHLLRPGHDARSRIRWSTTVRLCSVRRFLYNSGAPGSRAVLDRTSGMRTLPELWRREKFIDQSLLIGDCVRF